MKLLKSAFSILILVLLAGHANAQSGNGNAVVSQLAVFENEYGMGEIELVVAGNQASEIEAVLVTVAGNAIPGGSYTVLIDNSRYLNPDPRFNATFLLLPASGNQPDHVVISVEMYKNVLGSLASAGKLPARDRIIERRRRG